jgi:hypothetical protein
MSPGCRPYRCAADGELDPAAFFKILVLAMAHRNTRTIKDKYQTMAAMMDNIPAIPIKMWNHSIARFSGSLRITPEPDVLRFLLFPRDKADVNGEGKGLVFRGLYYSNPVLMDSGAFVKARDRHRNSRLDVVYDPRLIDVIYLVCDSNRTKIQPCFLSDRSACLRGRHLTFDDVKGIQDEKAFLNDHGAKIQEQARIEYKSAVNDIMVEQRDKNETASTNPHTVLPTTKKEARGKAGKADKVADARVLTDPASGDDKTIQFPIQKKGSKSAGQNPAAVPRPLSAKELALQAIYKKG